MTVRVTDPAGEQWVVSREWFRRPEWSHESPDPGDDVIDAAGQGLQWAGMFDDGWWGVLFVLFGSVLVGVIFFVFLPLVFAVLGLLAALVIFGARLVLISPWIVVARSRNARLEWRVRGTLRSARAVSAIGASLESGDERPLLDGRPPDVVAASQV